MVDTAVRLLVLLAAIQQIVFPIFVNPFEAGAQPVRASIPSQLEPAGYAFSIWGPIYLLALGYGIWQFTTAGRLDPATARIAPLAIALYLGSSIWLWCAKFGPLWATPPILATMAACAVGALLISLEDRHRSGAAWWLVVLPFALYAGWTLCATFVNFAEVAPAYGFGRFGLSTSNYALFSIITVSALASLVLWLSQANLPFAGTIIWALVAIAVAGTQRNAEPTVVFASGGAAIAVVVLTILIRSTAQTEANS